MLMPVTDEDKRNLIVKEIETWRRSKLLPEQYCDFLQNLYLDDWEQRPKSWRERTARRLAEASGRLWLLGIGIFTIICLVVLHFSAFAPVMQIFVSAAAAAGLTIGAVRARGRSPALGALWLAAGALLTLGGGIAVLAGQGWTSGAGPIVLLGVCATAWVSLGIALRAGWLHGCGWLAAIVLYARLLASHVDEPSWFEVQLFWLPAALLFGWGSWFLHVRLPSAGAALFAIALLLWFMPEVYSALFGVDRDWIQAQLLGKIVLAGYALYRYRQRWVEWVTA